MKDITNYYDVKILFLIDLKKPRLSDVKPIKNSRKKDVKEAQGPKQKKKED